MPYLVVRFFDRLTIRQWRAYVVVLAVAFATGWLLLYLFEPDGADLQQPQNYWWYFTVSGSSTGYGDLYPKTAGGRIGGTIIILTGVSVGLTLVMQLALMIERRRRKRMLGLAQLHQRGHLVVVGYREDQLLELIRQVRADNKSARMPVVAVFFPGQLVDENPHDDTYDVIRWNESALERANLGHAQAVYINAPSDDQSVHLLVQVTAKLTAAGNTAAHVIVGIGDHARYQEILSSASLIRPGTEVVSSSNVTTVSDAIQNPGVSVIYEQLQSNLDPGASLYRIDIPQGNGVNHLWSWFEVAVHLMQLGYNLLGYAESHRPDAVFRLTPGPDAFIRGGYSIVVVGPDRPVLDWSQARLTAEVR
jgi:voltage-gated potassium channel